MRNISIALLGVFIACSLNLTAQDVVPKLSADIIPSDCSGVTGSIDHTVTFPGNFIFLNEDTKLSVPSLSFVGKRSFSIEGRIRVSEGAAAFKARNYVALFGQKNTVSLGFRNGKLACKLETNAGAIVYTEDGAEPDKNIFPTDGDWHHVALRGNGNKIELLIDGAVVGEKAMAYSSLSSVGSTESITIGDDVWGQAGEAFKGEIERISCWEKYLTDADFTALNLQEVSAISKDAAGLLVAYNVNKAQEGKLIATGPAGGDSYDIVSRKVKMEVTVEKFAWKGPNGVILTEDISSSRNGSYIYYLYYFKEGIRKNLSKTYVIPLIEDLEVSIEGDNFYGCEGKEVKVNTLIKGGLESKSYEWILGYEWEAETIVGTATGFVSPSGFVGSKPIKLKVVSGVCEKRTEVSSVDIGKAIKTNAIRRK